MPRNVCMVDLDGTAIDSFDHIAMAAGVTRSTIGLPELSKAAIEETIGLSAALLFPEIKDDLTLLERAVSDFRSRLKDASSSNKTFPGVVDVLSELKADGWRIAIATNKPQSLAEHIIRNSEICEVIDEICGSFGDDHKPKPDILLRCLKDSTARTRLMIGDRPEDMRAAAAAPNVTGVGLSLGRFGKVDLLTAGATYAFESWLEMGENIERIKNP